MPAEPAPGQAAYEAMMARYADIIGPNALTAESWEDLGATERAMYDDGAAAVAAPLNAEITRLRERLAGAEATARLYGECEAELQEVHAVLVTAYAGRELSEDTPAVVAALASERDGLAAQLDQAEAEADAEAEAAGMRLDRLRIADTDLRRRLDDLASHWNREYASETGWPSRCAAELREALEGSGDD